MSNETAAVKRPAGGRRGGATGSQTVGEYTGQRAGDAAQAVRRAGLRPGLERSFGCDPSLLGLVISQEPAAGSALARNGMVTLHVAAPGTGSAAADTSPAPQPAPPPAPEPRRESEPAPARRDVGGGDRELSEATGTARRRRKPGLSGRAPEVFDVPPAPIPLAATEPQAADDGEQDWGELVEPEPTYEVDGAEFSEETISEEDGFDGLTADEFVVHVDDVFAGRTGRWRPVRRAPRTRSLGRGLRERLRAHPWLAGSAAFAIGLWLLLGTLGALAGQHPAAPARTAPPRLTARDPIARAAIVRAPLRRRVEHRASTRRRVLPRGRARAAARPARAARPRVPAPAPTPAPGQPAAAAPSVPARVSEPAPPPAEQTSGGLFSP